MRRVLLTVAALAVTGYASSALAGYNMTQSATAPTPYTDYTLNFDEPGGPVGPLVGNEWQATHGLTTLSGVGTGGTVDDWSVFYGWPLGDGLSLHAPWGLWLTFDEPIEAFAAQVWESSGPPSPMGGGMGVVLKLDGLEVGNWIVEPGWGGIGDTWFDLTGDGGDVFDEVVFIGYGWVTDGTFIDNMSWNVPAPGCLALLGLAGLVGRRRRA